MKITDYQLSRFNDMVKDFARRNGISAKVETSSLDMSRTDVHMDNGHTWKHYVMFWPDVKSLTDAGTQIFTDASIFFGLGNHKSAGTDFEIKNVIFNDPATIVFWTDGTKTVVKCQEDDVYSEEVGLALCFAKKALGNKSNFNNVFKKWIPEKEEEPAVIGVDPFSIKMRNIGENAKSSSNILDEVRKLLNRPITPDEV